MVKDTGKNKFEAFFKSFSDADEALDFRMGSEKEQFDTITTGSYAVDDCTGGVGGVPQGRLTQFYGPAGSGKTLMAILAAKQAQKKDQSSYQMWIDSEGTLDLGWCEALGVDTSRLLIVDGDTAVNGRSCFEMLLGVPKEDARTHELKGKSKEGFLDKVINKEFNVNLIVLDSLGSVQPPGEDISPIGKQNISLMARFLPPTLRRLSLEVKKANCAFIFINHKKDNMDPYGADHTYSGGNAYTHFLGLNVYFEAIQRKDAQILDEKENRVGQSVRCSVEKTKSGSQKKCEFKIHFGKGIIDLHEELATLALDYDIVKKPTSMSYEYGDKKWVGMGKFTDAIKEDESFANELADRVREARLNKWNKDKLSVGDKIVDKAKKTDRSINKEEVA